MTLLVFDGFELGDGNLRYQVTGTNTFVTGTNTRFNSGAAMRYAAPYAIPFTPSTDLYMGCSLSTISLLDTTIRPSFTFRGDSGTTNHIWVGMKSTGLEARLGTSGGTLLASAAGTFYANTHYHWEMYAKVADSGGRVVVKIDGVTLIDFTGDTKNGGTATQIDSVLHNVNGVVSDMDDLWICNGLGSVNNGYLGDKRVHTLSPSGAGNSTQMTPSTGANYTTVDETPYSATDYVQGSSGQKDTYAMADLPATATAVAAVQVASVMKKTDAGAFSARNVVRSASTDYAGTTRSLGTSDASYVDLYETDPATSAAWTASNVNAVQAGVEAL